MPCQVCPESCYRRLASPLNNPLGFIAWWSRMSLSALTLTAVTQVERRCLHSRSSPFFDALAAITRKACALEKIRNNIVQQQGAVQLVG